MCRNLGSSAIMPMSFRHTGMRSNINKNWIWHKRGNVEVHALIIFMGLAKYPKISDYWSRYFVYHNLFVPAIKSQNRFQETL